MSALCQNRKRRGASVAHNLQCDQITARGTQTGRQRQMRRCIDSGLSLANFWNGKSLARAWIDPVIFTMVLRRLVRE
jgi:hypothetical protein